MSKALAKKEEAPAPSQVIEGDAMLALIERAARDPQMDVDKMDRLFQMRERLMASAAKTAYLAALSDLQAELPAVERKGTGHNQKKYARFEDFIETVKPINAKHGFSLTYRIAQLAIFQGEGKPSEPAGIKITGVLGHKAGHQEETSLTLPADTSGNKNGVQAHGSTISYGKRYVGLTLLGVATEDEDDDGKKAGAPLRETITEEQETELLALMKKADVEDRIIFEHFKVSKLADLTPDEHKTAIKKCKKKLGQV